MSSPETRLDRYLHEALATERALITTLAAHLAATPPGVYRRLLERHLHETRAHAVALSSRLESDSSVSGAAIGLAQTALGQLLALVKGPFDLLRGGTDVRETMLKNAKAQCASEALEIATYDAIEALAETIGDTTTVALARAHRVDEERMLAALRALIPTLTVGAQAKPVLPITDYDLNAGQVAAALPWAGYDSEDTQAILERLNRDVAGAVRDYESRHRRRVAVLEAAQQALTGR